MSQEQEEERNYESRTRRFRYNNLSLNYYKRGKYLNNYNLKFLIDKKNNFKRPPQFQNMSNEFEVAQWVAHHQRILNLAINISNGMATSIPADKEETVTSSVIL